MYPLTRSLTHPLYSTLALVRFFCPRPCYYGNGVVGGGTDGYFRGEGRIENRAWPIYVLLHPLFFSAFHPLLSLPPSLPPTHLPNRIMQRRKDGAAALLATRKAAPSEGSREGRREGGEGHIQSQRKPPHPPPPPPPSPPLSPYTNRRPRTINAAKRGEVDGRRMEHGPPTDRRTDGRIEGATSFLGSLFRVMKVHLRVGGAAAAAGAQGGPVPSHNIIPSTSISPALKGGHPPR